VVIAIQINLLGYVYGSLTFVYNIGIIFLNLMVIHLLIKEEKNYKYVHVTSACQPYIMFGL